jgi:hypothetical protein
MDANNGQRHQKRNRQRCEEVCHAPLRAIASAPSQLVTLSRI